VENGKKVNYPKQISTTPKKAILGQYLRKRMGVPEGKAITIQDFERYGRKTIDVSLQGEGIYLFDFSVGNDVAVNTPHISLAAQDTSVPIAADSNQTISNLNK